MAFVKRISLFLLVNILVMVTISLVLSILGVGPYITAHGLNLPSLMVFCFVWGMGGAFISLGLSRIMAKKFMGVQLIDPMRASGADRQILDLVYRLSRAARLPVMPEVGIYQSPELNAFATGPSKKRALVAVSTGILSSMTMTELEGVLGHEISHVANGDMVTMTLIQGIVNAFTMFLSRVIAFAVTQNMRESQRYIVRMLITFALDVLLTSLGSLVVAYYSRAREFRADSGGAKLAGRDTMIAALRRLETRLAPPIAGSSQQFDTLKISAGERSGFSILKATHPPLSERIRRLQTLNLGA